MDTVAAVAAAGVGPSRPGELLGTSRASSRAARKKPAPKDATMKTTLVAFAALTTAPLLTAQETRPQEPKPGAQVPNPRTKAHEALALLAGDWQTSCRIEAVPGVPGMETAVESTGTERIELVCNGLWAKATFAGVHAGEACEGVWLLGYDPFAKGYKLVFVSSQEDGAMEMDATFDDATRTWTFTGTTAQGTMRSVFVHKDANTSVETCYMTPPGGKEIQCAAITRVRSKAAEPRDALAKVAKIAPKPASPELARLTEGTGTWDATVTMAMPGQAATTEKATETVASICNGKWTWSDFRGSMLGMPFEGHALVGYDATKQRYVGVWIDSCSATHSITTGTFDEAAKAVVMRGSCLCPEGKPMRIEQTCAQTDANTRTCDMTFQGEHGTQTMKVAYRRAKS
jgi:hypothetical protein